jgi:hypothetical protein
MTGRGEEGGSPVDGTRPQRTERRDQNGVVQPLLTGAFGDVPGVPEKYLHSILLCRSVPNHHGLRVLEVGPHPGQGGVRPVLQKEPLQRRVHHLCRTGGVPEIPGELSLFRQRYGRCRVPLSKSANLLFSAFQTSTT